MKRPPETEFHIQEKFEIMENDSLLKDENNEKEKDILNKDSSINLIIGDPVSNNNVLNDEINNEVIVNSSENQTLAQKKEGEEKKKEIMEDEYDEEIANALNKILEQEEDFSTKIKNNLKKFKQKNIDIEGKNNENKSQKIEEENENITLDLFNWKKRKLF